MEATGAKVHLYKLSLVCFASGGFGPISALLSHLAACAVRGCLKDCHKVQSFISPFLSGEHFICTWPGAAVYFALKGI